jgi:hypothetical protein|tara:strand:+ start:664 stop:1125 length:462 start_codon:yes stop_codon:yes gene_type:complete
MVSLIELYNIKEDPFSEVKDHGDPARGNKGKGRESEFYFVHGEPDPETGAQPSKVIYKRSFKNMVGDIEAEAIDMKKLSDEHPDDMVIYKLAEELKEIFNTFRTHVRKNYPNEYKKLEEDDLDENTLGGAGSGASFNAGNSMAYMGKKTFKKK